MQDNMGEDEIGEGSFAAHVVENLGVLLVHLNSVRSWK